MSVEPAIVICCDGTKNTFGRQDTNVRRLFDLVDDAKKFHRYYDTGLGTDIGERGVDLFSTGLSNIGGAALAFGQQRKVFDAYRFLCEYHKPDTNVFLFGFSRGAWCVRRLAKMVSVVGLLPPGHEHLIPHAYRAYDLYDGPEDDEPYNDHRKDNKAQHKRVYESVRKVGKKRIVKFIFIGVWDTVRSANFRLRPKNCYLHDNGKTEMVGRHALALDERRSAFEPELWYNNDRVKQRWFPGDHGDVGGGNQNAGSKDSDRTSISDDVDLSYLSLAWICREAKAAGLDLRLEPILAREAAVRQNLETKRQTVSDKSSPWPTPPNRRVNPQQTQRRLRPEYETDYDVPAIRWRVEKTLGRDVTPEKYCEEKGIPLDSLRMATT